MDRRSFLAATAPLLLPLRWSGGWGAGGGVRFGVIADPHHGLAPDAQARLEAFAEAARGRGLDFVVQMGDFCHPTDDARAFIETFDGVGPARWHVLGNHDMDKGTKAEAMDAWGMAERFHSFDAGGHHFVVLDLNHMMAGGERVPYANANFYVDGSLLSWADEAQLEWLRADLARTALPTIVLSHQPIGLARDVGGALPAQQEEIFAILRESAQVVACMCGHLHVDRAEARDGIQCVCINSASYFWRGGMHPYRDPLFAFVTIEGGVMAIEGVASEMARETDREGIEALREGIVGVDARISDRRLDLVAR